MKTEAQLSMTRLKLKKDKWVKKDNLKNKDAEHKIASRAYDRKGLETGPGSKNRNIIKS